MSNDVGEPTLREKALSALKRFSLGIASGGAYRVGKSFERELRLAQRRERIETEGDSSSEDS